MSLLLGQHVKMIQDDKKRACVSYNTFDTSVP